MHVPAFSPEQGPELTQLDAGSRRVPCTAYRQIRTLCGNWGFERPRVPGLAHGATWCVNDCPLIVYTATLAV